MGNIAKYNFIILIFSINLMLGSGNSYAEELYRPTLTLNQAIIEINKTGQKITYNIPELRYVYTKEEINPHSPQAVMNTFKSLMNDKHYNFFSILDNEFNLNPKRQKTNANNDYKKKSGSSHHIIASDNSSSIKQNNNNPHKRKRENDEEESESLTVAYSNFINKVAQRTFGSSIDEPI